MLKRNISSAEKSNTRRVAPSQRQPGKNCCVSGHQQINPVAQDEEVQHWMKHVIITIIGFLMYRQRNS